MKHKFLNLIIIFVLFFSITSCSKHKSISTITENQNQNPSSKFIKQDTYNFIVPKSDNPNGIKVIYDLNNGFKFYSTATQENLVLKPEANPTKIASTFLGWYSDIECKIPFNFKKEIKKETTVYAGYETDYKEISNLISDNILKTSVKVISTFTESTLGGQTYESIGSGVIIAQTSNYYYCLTNNHVIYKPEKYKYEEYKIYDCFNNAYTGIIAYADSNYDLALMYFNKIPDDGKTTDTLDTITFTSNMPNEKDTVITVGNPKRVMNTITYGSYVSLDEFNSDEESKIKSDIKFSVIDHTAKINDGSSGSMLLDSNLRLIGINFASKVSASNEYLYSYAIPYYKVIEFIQNYEKQSPTN